MNKNLNEQLLDAQTVQAIRNLIEQGANINYQDPDPGWGCSALMIAIKDEDLDRAKVLLELGIDIDLQDYYGETALHHAAINNSVDEVKLLISNDANPFITNYETVTNEPGNETDCTIISKNGKTPLEEAKWSKRQDQIIELLEAYEKQYEGGK